MKIKYILILLVSVLFFTACEKDDDDIPEEQDTLLSIAKADSKLGNFNVELLAEETLFQGYNELLLDIKRNSDNSRVKQAAITLLPVMQMTMMSHAAPVENPETTPDDGYFEGAVVFIMPGNADEGWSLAVAIDSDGIKDTVNFTIPEVNSLEEAREFSVVSETDGKTYFISLLEPFEPEVGINDIEFTVHYRENMMSFPAAEDLTITIEPEMPSMGHGSPNNVNPVHTGNGHYEGKVNFTMTGWWRVNIEVSRNGDPIGENLSFNITF